VDVSPSSDDRRTAGAGLVEEGATDVIGTTQRSATHEADPGVTGNVHGSRPSSKSRMRCRSE
jgi:hypothetical protein